jgi:phosphatidylserine/phosphatidylglycerophosphate/cardiolipin synthase-like enzyme
VNDGTAEIQQLQDDSLAALAAAEVDVHVSGPNETAQLPYMHARAAVVDGKVAYLGSISLSPDSITFNREMGLVLRQRVLVRKLEEQFQSDYGLRTTKFLAAVLEPTAGAKLDQGTVRPRVAVRCARRLPSRTSTRIRSSARSSILMNSDAVANPTSRQSKLISKRSKI